VFVVYHTPSQESVETESFEIDMEIELDENGELSMDLDDMLSSLTDETPSVSNSSKGPNESSGTATSLSVSEASPVEASNDGLEDASFSSRQDSAAKLEAEQNEAVQDDSEPSEEQIAALDVNSLNFASVGIKSWKVKKTIGLMFEYSDFKTFKKSLNDGRISSADQISPDGANWTPMADIPDFERFFCLTYLKFEKSGFVETVKPIKEKVIPSIGGTNELASALAAAQAEVEQANKPKNTARRNAAPKATRRPTSAPVPPPKQSSGVGLNLGIGALVVVVGWFLFGKKDEVPPPVPSKPVVETPAKAEVEDESLKALREELRRNAAKIEAEQEVVPEPSAEEEPQLIAKVPEEILAQQRAMQTGNPPVIQAKTVNHALEGQQALTSKQWDKAIKSFNQAYQNNPNPEYLSSVGFAQFKSGKLADSKKTLLNAVQKGAVSANKWLGYVMREEGDIAGSNQYFNQYLQSNPADASVIKQEMMQ
jgi:hypothetical protein